MPYSAIFLSLILLSSSFLTNSFFSGDLIPQNFQSNEIEFTNPSGFLKINQKELLTNPNTKRYLIFGSGQLDNIKSSTTNNIYSIETANGFFSVVILSHDKISSLISKGYFVIEDFPLDFHQNSQSETEEISKIGEIVGSEEVHKKYQYTGSGINIAIVDTGVDFSNPDIQQSLARDKKNIPIMLDADGQGIVLTNATFFASIDENGILRNFTKPLPENVTSKVYRTKDGVFLDINRQGKGTVLQIYNSFYPLAGSAPIFNGTLSDDMKIGKDHRDYVVSKSGLYRLGIIYQGSLSGPLARIQVVPVLVVDSEKAGVYDTIIPDMSTSWMDYTRFDLPRGERPNYDFDFTDETPIKIGSGTEFLLYDSDKDGKNDYSAGTIGARVLDVHGVISSKKSQIDKTLRAINGTLLPPMDPSGEFFGIMTDFMGHGTAGAASIVSKGVQEYDIYNNTKKFKIIGVAPDAKIIPTKALWFGDTVYAWLWLAGLDNDENKWKYSGVPRVDIISNSWGVSNFPTLQAVPGFDILSLILSVLSTPKSIDLNYPGIIMVTSAGNSGHGYGTLGLPTASPFGITVGATTNNVFVGYGPFKDEPRFGNTTDQRNNIVDFTSRGPSFIGDPKPDLVSIGAHSFTPSSVTKLKKDSKEEAFSLFGGTSMAAPLVSGSAALVIQAFKEKSKDYDPFLIKNIMMSTAKDLQNDPFTQGSGLVDVHNAIKLVVKEEGMFFVHNDASYSNVKHILDPTIQSVNATAFGVERFELPQSTIGITSWFGGHLFAGDRTTTTFTIENPTDKPIEIKIKPQNLQLIKQTQIQKSTEVQLQDPILNKSGTYAPNYIRLSDVKEHKDLPSLYDEINPIPQDASLLVLNVNFPFESFMNKTDEIYANDLKISSLYMYDWLDKNNDTKVASDELSMVNRGGSWGTVQELRVSDPNSKFENTPLVGAYPVPTRFSYWLGETKHNATSMNYTLTASYFKKSDWGIVWVEKDSISVPPNSSAKIKATIAVPSNFQTGVYQGSIIFEGKQHTLNLPVSFVVKKKIEQKDSMIVISGRESSDVLFGDGYVKGAIDMVNRYTAGDWRYYYFDIDDRTINTATIDVMWQNKDSNLSLFVVDPKGRIVSTNVPSGVFGHFLGWPSIDWLGVTPFSQGGGFFPVKNKNDTSSIVAVPINQTGTYGLLIHSTLFEGKSLTEPITVAAKFTTISSDDKEPLIKLSIPKYISDNFPILPLIEEENLYSVIYYLDGEEFTFDAVNPINSQILPEGSHEIKIVATDISGNKASLVSTFTIDKTQPQILVNSPKNGTKVSNVLEIDFGVDEVNIPESDAVFILLPSGETVVDKNSYKFDTTNLENGDYLITVTAKDRAENVATKKIQFSVDHFIQQPLPISPQYDFVLIASVIAIGIVIAAVSIFLVLRRAKISAT